MILATDDIGMSILLDPAPAGSLRHGDGFGSEDGPVGLTPCFGTPPKAMHGEIGTTELIRSQGYEADALLTSFNAAEQNLVTYCREAGSPPDVLFDGAYFGTNVHPYETVFMKANRGVSEATLRLMTELHLNQSWTSWDSCG